MKQLESPSRPGLASQPISRMEMIYISTQMQRSDLVLSFFPVDINLQASGKYERLTDEQIYQSFHHNGDYLLYTIPSTILAGGLFLPHQPKGLSLITDLAIHLRRVEAIFRHLAPDWLSIGDLVKQLYQTDIENDHRKRMAEDIARHCRTAARSTALFKRRAQIPSLEEEFVEEKLKSISRSMANIVRHGHETKDEDRRIKEFGEHLQSWGWVMLLQYIKDTSIFLSCDLFS